MPQNVLSRMKLAEGVYVLSPWERPVNVLHQQRRAVNLAWALEQTYGAESKPSVAVVGGGVAGLTCAAYLGRTGFSVTMVERSRRLLPLFNESIRYLHPRIYDWPDPGFLSATSDLPLLNWRSGLACDVAENIQVQFDGWAAACGIRLRKGTRAKLDRAELGTLQLVDRRGMRKRKYDVIILAPGFGSERFESNAAKTGGQIEQPWWRLDRTYVESLRDARLHIVGNGDGGLSDLIESIGLSQPMLGSPEWLAALRDDQLLRTASELETWVFANAFDQRYSREFDEKYAAFDSCSAQVDALLSQAVARTTHAKVERWISGKSTTMLTSQSYALNRYLVYRLTKLKSKLAIYYNVEGASPNGTTRVLRPGPAGRFQDEDRDFPGWEQKLREVSQASGEPLTKPRWATWTPPPSLGTALRPGMADDQLKLMSTFYNPEPQRRAWDRLSSVDYRRLYLGRLRRDILMFNKVVLTDAQILDGVYFRRHFSDLKPLKSKIEISTRGRKTDDWAQVLMHFTSTPVESKQGSELKGRFMSFWSLPEHSRTLVESSLPRLDSSVLGRGAKDSLRAIAPTDTDVRQLCEDWDRMLSELGDGWVRIWKRDTQPHDQRTRFFSDLGALCAALRTEEARLLAAEVWQASTTTTRNTFDARIDALDPADADSVRMWMYNGYDSVLAKDYGVPAATTLWLTPLDEVTIGANGEVYRLPDPVVLGSLDAAEFNEVADELRPAFDEWRRGQASWQDVWRAWRSLPLVRPKDIGSVSDGSEWGRRCSGWLDPHPQLECWNVAETTNSHDDSPRILLREKADGRTSSLTTLAASLWTQHLGTRQHSNVQPSV